MQNPLPGLGNRTLTNSSMANSTHAGMLFRGVADLNNQMKKIFLLIMKAE